MAVYRYYRCPDCGSKFRYLHHPNPEEDPFDGECPICNSGGAEITFFPTAPGIRKSPLVKSVDQTYRGMEEASIQRAKEAESIAWDAARASGMTDTQIRDTKITDMSNIKITNMRDPSEMREGDTASIGPPPTSPVVHSLKNMAAQGGGGGFNPLVTAGGNVIPGQVLAQNAHADGIQPHAGEFIRQATNMSHNERAWKMQKAGEMGSYSGKG